MKLVLDASAFGPIVIPVEFEDQLPGLGERLSSGGAHVPAHWPAEVANLLLIARRRNRIDADGQLAAFETARSVIVEVDEGGAFQHLLGPTWDLAEKHRLTVYDAAYLELAIRLSALLATNDAALIRAAGAEGVEMFGR